MKETQQEKITNLVQFPSSKNYPLESTTSLDLNDPLEDLLNEFSHLPDDIEESEEEIHIYKQELKEEVISVSRAKPTGRLDRVVHISKQLKTLEETTKRMSFLIDEIENFLPKKVRK
jgi:hypothetical protein